MGRRIATLAYDHWIEHVFSHDVPTYQPRWYNEPDCDWFDGTPAESVRHLTRLFEDPEPALAYFADSQIAQGLHYLIDPGASNHSHAAFDRAVPLAERLRCLSAIHNLFARIFAPRCAPVLSHLDEPGAVPLNGVCYMWWDIFPDGVTPQEQGHADINRAVLDTMQRSLALDSIACQEGALHGLGHARRYDPGAVEAVIDAYLKSKPDLNPKLAAYARAARSGCVL